MNNLIIYHGGGCPDGSAAAWCAQRFLGRDNCILYPDIYGTDTLPPFEKVKAADKTYILDFSYSREAMLVMSGMTDLLVLDHHASVEAICKDLDFCEFDMKRSGAGMAWDHFFPDESRPWFIDYIEDRDIWKWFWPNSRFALAYIDTMPQEYEVYERLLEGDISHGDCVEKGVAICQYIEQYNKDSIEASLRYVDFQAPSGRIHLDVPMVNVSYKGISLVLAELAKGHGFALGWFRRNDGKYQYSIRVSEDSDFDGAKLAACYGGGGHRKSAGFTLDHELEELPTSRSK